MRKVVFFIILFLPLAGFAQLNDIAQIQKTQHPERYQIVKDFAVNKWGDDYEMTVHEINTQCQSMENMRLLMSRHFENPKDNFDMEVLLRSIFKWENKSDSQYNINNIKKLTDKTRTLAGLLKMENEGSDIGSLKDTYKQEVLNTLVDFKTDWQMAEYEYNNQLKAKQSL